MSQLYYNDNSNRYDVKTTRLTLVHFPNSLIKA